jgi:hypothetical protein
MAATTINTMAVHMLMQGFSSDRLRPTLQPFRVFFQ